MALPRVVDITNKGRALLYCYHSLLLRLSYWHLAVVSHLLYYLMYADGPSPREILANQLASVLEMRRRKQKVSFTSHTLVS